MTLAERTQGQIKQMILNKEYDSNHYLPSEGELCKIFSVSRVTVRDAVSALETRGFLKRIHGKGLLVLDNSVSVMSRSINDMISQGDCSTDHLMEVRAIVEEACASLAAQRATPKDLEVLEQAVVAMEQADQMDDTYFSYDLQFHVQLARATQNPLLSAIVNAYTPLLRDNIIRASHVDYIIEVRYHYHRNIYNFIADGDSKAAARAMRSHLRATEKNQHIPQ